MLKVGKDQQRAMQNMDAAVSGGMFCRLD